MKKIIILISLLLFSGYNYLQASTSNINNNKKIINNNNNNKKKRKRHPMPPEIDGEIVPPEIEDRVSMDRMSPELRKRKNKKLKIKSSAEKLSEQKEKELEAKKKLEKELKEERRKYLIEKNVEIKQLQLKLLELTQDIDKLNIKTSKLLNVLKNKKDNIFLFKNKNSNFNINMKQVINKKMKIKNKKQNRIKYYKLTANFIPLFFSMNFEKISPIHLLDNSTFKFETNKKNFYKLAEPLLIDKKIVKNGKVILSEDYKRAYLRNEKLKRVALIDKNSKIEVKFYNDKYYEITNNLFVYKINLMEIK